MIVLDERGKACPLPVVETKKALEAAASGETARVLVDNEIAVQNLRKLADHKGWSFCWEKRGGGDFQAWITREAGESLSEEKQRETEEPECPDCRTEGIRPGLTAVISSEAMGQGDDRLGKILMKSFLFALTQQDILPETVLLYNGGAFLSCEGSESLEDLKKLEELGVEILTCGNCLGFYGLKEKLAVGGMTNMYEIVEKQCRAHTILRS